MIGSLLNALAILLGGLLGLLAGKRFSKSMTETITWVIGVVTIFFGIQMALETQNILVGLISLVVGAVIGETLEIERRLELFSKKIEIKVEGKRSGSQFARAFLTTSILYCTGALVFLGPIEEGLTGGYKILLFKSVIDGFASIVFASTMGLGVLFSAGTVLVVEGGLTLGARFSEQWMTQPMITEGGATGGIILFLLGLKILEVKSSRVGNLIPAIFVAPLLIYLSSKLGLPLTLR